MNIRSNNDDLERAATSETTRGEQAPRTAGAGKPAALPGANVDDRLQLSALSEAIAASETQRADIVERLAAAYRSGAYQADSTSIARALVNHALEAGGAQSDQ